MCRDVIEKSLLENLRSEVHVWYCRPEAIEDENRLSAYRSVLSEQEKEKLDRFRFSSDRRNYLVSHAMLRVLLSEYISVAASDIPFSHNDHGKPALANHTELPAIQFNLTHTDGLCACVIALDIACGIDAENIHRKNNLAALAQRMFSDEEQEAMMRAAQPDCFYDFWTLRESYVKALGTGLAGSSKDFFFTVADTAGQDNYMQDMVMQRMATLNHGSESHLSRADRQGNHVSEDWRFLLSSPTRQHRMAVAYASSKPLHVKLCEFTD